MPSCVSILCMYLLCAFVAVKVANVDAQTVKCYTRHSSTGIQKCIATDEMVDQTQDQLARSVSCDDPSDAIIGMSYRSDNDYFQCEPDTDDYGYKGSPASLADLALDDYRYGHSFNEKLTGLRLRCNKASGTPSFSGTKTVFTTYLCADPKKTCGELNGCTTTFDSLDSLVLYRSTKDMYTLAGDGASVWGIGVSCQRSNQELDQRDVEFKGTISPHTVYCKVYNDSRAAKNNILYAGIQSISQDYWDSEVKYWLQPGFLFRDTAV